MTNPPDDVDSDALSAEWPIKSQDQCEHHQTQAIVSTSNEPRWLWMAHDVNFQCVISDEQVNNIHWLIDCQHCHGHSCNSEKPLRHDPGPNRQTKSLWTKSKSDFKWAAGHMTKNSKQSQQLNWQKSKSWPNRCNVTKRAESPVGQKRKLNKRKHWLCHHDCIKHHKCPDQEEKHETRLAVRATNFAPGIAKISWWCPKWPGVNVACFWGEMKWAWWEQRTWSKRVAVLADGCWSASLTDAAGACNLDNAKSHFRNTKCRRLERDDAMVAFTDKLSHKAGLSQTRMRFLSVVRRNQKDQLFLCAFKALTRLQES